MDFVAIDFETAKMSRESACSVGLVKYIDNKKIDSFYSLIKPPVLYIRPEFTKIHGLTVDDIKDAPIFPQIWESQMKPFIGDLPLLAHKASFDMSVLKSVLEWYELEVPIYNYFDSLAIAKKVWPEFECHKLTFLGETFGIKYDAHNALADSETCAKVVLLALDKLSKTKKNSALIKQKISVPEFLAIAECNLCQIE